jgi:hypothetical protein
VNDGDVALPVSTSTAVQIAVSCLAGSLPATKLHENWDCHSSRAAAVAIGTGIASAQPDDGEGTPITGDALTKATRRWRSPPGGTVTEIEVGVEESYYEVEVTPADVPADLVRRSRGPQGQPRRRSRQTCPDEPDHHPSHHRRPTRHPRLHRRPPDAPPPTQGRIAVTIHDTRTPRQSAQFTTYLVRRRQVGRGPYRALGSRRRHLPACVNSTIHVFMTVNLALR